jgi:hypothetical protein
LLPAFPVLAALGLGVLRQARKVERGGPPHRSRVHAWLPAGGAWQFSLLVLAPCLLFLVVFKAELGVPRDWDLFALTSVGLVAVAFVVVDRFLALADGHRAGIVAVPVWVISAALGIGWIGVNANSQRSAARYASILEYEQANASYAYEILAKHYYREARMPEATGAMEEAVRYSPSPRMYVYLAKLYKAQGRVVDALRVLRETVAAYPPHQGARNDLVLLLDAVGSYDELLGVARDGTRLHPDAAVFRFYYGKALMRTGQTEAGIEQLLECKRLNPGSNITTEIDRMIERR